jgi:hypothetical protein
VSDHFRNVRKQMNDHFREVGNMIRDTQSDTPISDSTPHNVGDLAMLCRRFERFAAGRQAYIKQLETENNEMRADLLLYREDKWRE